MTTDPTAPAKGPHWVTVSVLALVGWFFVSAAATLLLDPKEVMAFGPNRTVLLAVSEARAQILDVRNGFIRTRSDNPGLSRQLYARGAWFVWPSLQGGCFGLTSPAMRRSWPQS
jgi:hypothetical protein